MSDSQAPGDDRGAGAIGSNSVLTPDYIESILADFRAWLGNPPSEARASPAEAVDLHTLVAQFTALRHEVNLQTRAVRQQQEQNAETLRQFGDGLRLLEERARQEPVDDEGERVASLLNALVDAADAQQLAVRELARVAATVTAPLKEAPPAAPTRLGRWLGLDRIAAVLQARSSELDRVRETIDAAATGLTLGLHRLERIMARHGLEPVSALGRPFDPETMEAVEAVAMSDRPAGEVLGELRRGYLLNGRLFRFAQVKVAK